MVFILQHHLILFTQNYSSILCDEQFLNNLFTTTNDVPLPTDQLCNLQSNEIGRLVRVVQNELGTSVNQVNEELNNNLTNVELNVNLNLCMCVSNENVLFICVTNVIA